MRVTAYALQGDGIMLLGDGINAPLLPPIQKSGSYPTHTRKSDCRATWSECGNTTRILSAEEKVAVVTKNLPFWEGKHSAWLAAYAFKTGEPEPLFMKLRGE